MIDYESWDLSIKDLLTIIIGIIAISFTVGLLFYDSFWISILLVPLGLFYIPKYKKSKINKRRDVLLLQFKDMLYSIASSFYSGRTMYLAIEEAEDFCLRIYDKNDMIVRELHHMKELMEKSNYTDIEALEQLADRTKIPEIKDFVSIFSNCKKTGADVITAVDKSTQLIGDKIQMEEELKALMSQKIFEGRIITVAPIALILIVRLMSPEYMRIIYDTSSGRIVATLALGIMLLSILLMERIYNVKI